MECNQQISTELNHVILQKAGIFLTTEWLVEFMKGLTMVNNTESVGL
jgi:hypothetical protein